MQVQGHPHPGTCSWLVASIVDLTPYLQVVDYCELPLSHGSRSSFGPPWPAPSSFFISHAVLSFDCTTRKLHVQTSKAFALKMRSRSSSSNFASSSLDLTLAMSSGLILQICLIMALSLSCKGWSYTWSTAKFHWYGTWRSAGKRCPHGQGSLRQVVGAWSWSQLFAKVISRWYQQAKW